MTYQAYPGGDSLPARYWQGGPLSSGDQIPVASDRLPVEAPKTRFKKRIVVCCDGTWQDGLVVNQRWKYTNVLRLARAINHSDERCNPPVPQVVFYQSGVGTDNLKSIETLEGAVGATLGDKVQEAYGFLAQNYHTGDEIYLFGFSRGAYTARMVASLIGAIGVLNKKDMDHFADIFIALQKRGKSTDEKEKVDLDDQLRPWTSHDSPGKRRADSDEGTFSVQCVGVFDTVGSIGLPEEITHHSDKMKTIFGFSDKFLGEHIARAYQAMALNEYREDFDCAKFEQTDGGRKKGQILSQCWFTGSHCDIGGGWQEHDLSDLSLFWMAGNIYDMLSLDLEYLKSLVDPVAPWGEQLPHNSLTGIYAIAGTTHRQLPKYTDDVTYETVHASVDRQRRIDPNLAENLNSNPSLLAPLSSLEEEIRSTWRVSPEKAEAYEHSKLALQPVKEPGDRKPATSIRREEHEVVEVAERFLKDGNVVGHRHGVQSVTHSKTVTTSGSGGTSVKENWFGKILEESSMGPFIKELTGNAGGFH